ncbi:MAG: histidine phosphatase family protein [Bacteriovoracaceae bacterium]|nr:histidine phosphatase family protein [Bacteriovoracaceae bacterium]
MTTLYLFRHGETNWNKEKRFQGHLDIPLNEEGRRQAQKLKSRLELLTPDAIVSSDLKRAVMTTTIAAEQLDVPTHFSELLREANLGEAQGKTQDEVKELWGENALKEWFTGSPEFKFPNGEPKKAASKRARDYISNFLKDHPCNKLAVSTHGYLIFRILCDISDVDPKTLNVGNCEIYEIEIDQSGVWKWVGAL